MTDTILVSAGIGETGIALISKDVVTEIHFFRQFAPAILHNVYFARLRRLAPEFAGAFVEIEPGKTAFLPDRKGRPAINRAEGAGLVVQVTKEQTGGKPPEVTENIGLKSRLLTLLPASTHIEIAKAIPADRKASLLELCHSLTEDKAGLRVRSSAAMADTTGIEQEYAALFNRWSQIQSAAQSAGKPHCLWQSPNPALEFVVNSITPDTQKIITDRAGMLADLKTATGFTDISMHNGNLFKIFDVEADIDSITDTRVQLKGGGWLNIEETEALTAIDVNAGAPDKSRPFDETVYNTNLTAAGEIARQLRLRQIGGLVVIDFINMKNKTHIRNVLSRLDQAIGTDPAPIRRTGFSAFGLIELTRKKTGPSLTALLTRKGGLAPAVDTLVLRALRHAECKGMEKPGGTLKMELAPDAARWLKSGHMPLITELAQRTGANVIIEENPDMASDCFSVYAE